MTITRDDLHELAELLADFLEHRRATAVEPRAPAPAATKAPRRRAAPTPPAIDRSHDISEANRAKARDALLRRGLFITRGINEHERRKSGNA